MYALLPIIRKRCVCFGQSAIEKDRGKVKEKERNDTMWKSFQRERRIRAARPPRRFDPSNQEIWAERVKRSESMDTSEHLESPLFPSGLTTIDRILVRLLLKFTSMEPPFGRIRIMELPFGRIRTMELPSGNILRASSRWCQLHVKRAAGKTYTWHLSINRKNDGCQSSYYPCQAIEKPSVYGTIHFISRKATRKRRR